MTPEDYVGLVVEFKSEFKPRRRRGRVVSLDQHRGGEVQLRIDCTAGPVTRCNPPDIWYRRPDQVAVVKETACA